MIYVLILFLLIRFLFYYIESQNSNSIIKKNSNNTFNNIHEFNAQQSFIDESKESKEIIAPKIEEKLKKTKSEILDKIEKISLNQNGLEYCLYYIKTRIEFIKEIDSDYEAFGSDRWKYEFRKVSEEEINSIENKYNKKLPIEFRTFLLDIGIGAAPVYGANPYYEEILIESYEQEPDSDESNKIYENGFIVISEHGCGIETRLSLDPSHYGEIWMHDVWDDKIADNYIDWYIKWINSLLIIFADGNLISFRTGQF